ncbi:hypothetical protein COUCH_25575 [Couchioplanes caeruleus]|uniref:hypothetical protein n=1 Tax=Couchioplanes caeruleus TaxID=56438 RepID=UPI0020C14062|nr:hypothetical protein [Couchioplanes caeruleus]UQU62392.1 hypothetical protein COUCH_25575 [Couchioplanes caeruleus]
MTYSNKTAAGFPVYADRARGARITDADGHEYVDFSLMCPETTAADVARHHEIFDAALTELRG